MSGPLQSPHSQDRPPERRDNHARRHRHSGLQRWRGHQCPVRFSQWDCYRSKWRLRTRCRTCLASILASCPAADGAVPPTTHAPCISQDFWTQRIRKIDLGTSETTTLAGPREGYRVWGIAGFKDGDGTSARFFFPQGIAIDPEGTYALVAVRACWPAHRLLAPCRRAYTANPPTSQTAILCLRLALL